MPQVMWQNHLPSQSPSPSVGFFAALIDLNGVEKVWPKSARLALKLQNQLDPRNREFIEDDR